MTADDVAVQKNRLVELETQSADIGKRLAKAEATNASMKKTFDRIKKTGAKPIVEILQTDAKWILAVSGIGGSAAGFVIGHASFGMKGAIVGIPVLGIVVFSLMARFVYNATILDVATVRQKGRQAVADAKHWKQEHEKMPELIEYAKDRLKEAETVFQAEQKKQQLAISQSPAPERSLRVIPATESSLSDVPWQDLPPTEKQLRYAAHLGIKIRRNETRGGLSDKIDAVLSQRSADRMQPVLVQTNVHIHQRSSRGVAILFNLFWPGIGQIYQGRAFAGLFFMVCTPVGYLFLLIPGLILHVICILDAALYRDRS